MISSTFDEILKSANPPPLPAKAEIIPKAKMLELTPELREALFPKTPVMYSAKFVSSKTEGISDQAKTEQRRLPASDDDQAYPLI